MSARNPPGIYRKASDGTGQETLVLGLDPTARVSDWSSDGRLLYTVRSGTSFDLWLLGPNGGKPEAFLETRYTEREGRFSPDGRWIAYSSDQSGRHEVYVRPSTPGGPEVRISKDGGSQPRWRHDGGELFYLDPIGRMFAVSLQEKGGVIVPGRAMPLFATGSSLTMAPPGQAGRGEYAVTRDGRRFLMITRIQDPSADPAHVVLNWPSLIRR
jgi:hypothetical protein